MGTLLQLGIRSLWNRRFTSLLTLLSIALSVSLLIGVENVSRSARASFQGTISQTDLIVGGRSSGVQLLLYTVFRIGAPTGNISIESYERFAAHPAVAWTIPISLGDSHRSFRVVATDDNYYEYYRFRGDRSLEFREGEAASDLFDVVLGSDVAARLGYTLGQRVVLSHGISRGADFMRHDDKPFTVVGILERTATPIDQSLYITLAGMEAIHVDWQSGAPPMPGQEVAAEEVRQMDLQPRQITSFLLRTNSRMETLRLQREINTFESEPLMAIIPGSTLAEFWRGISYAENGFQLVSLFVVLIGLSGMMVAIYNSLQERRREMAILRALGCSPNRIVALLVIESTLLSAVGALVGMALYYLLAAIGGPLVEYHYGIYLTIEMPALREWIWLGAVVVAGFLIGFVPAIRAYRNTLVDGLTQRL